MYVVGLGRAEHVYVWMEGRTTSLLMPVELGMCPSTGGRHSSVPGEITLEELSESELRGALLESGCPRKVLEVTRKEALIPPKMKTGVRSRRTQLL